MKRPLEFRSTIMTSALETLDAHDRAILNSTLTEVDAGDLESEVLTPDIKGVPDCWDVCLALVFNGGIEVRHWSRIVRHRPRTRFDLHAKVRRLSGDLTNPGSARRVTEKIKAIDASPVTATIFFFAIARLDDGRTHETLWWHPSMTKAEALIALDSMVHYGLEEHD